MIERVMQKLDAFFVEELGTKEYLYSSDSSEEVTIFRTKTDAVQLNDALNYSHQMNQKNTEDTLYMGVLRLSLNDEIVYGILSEYTQEEKKLFIRKLLMDVSSKKFKEYDIYSFTFQPPGRNEGHLTFYAHNKFELRVIYKLNKKQGENNG